MWNAPRSKNRTTPKQQNLLSLFISSVCASQKHSGLQFCWWKFVERGKKEEKVLKRKVRCRWEHDIDPCVLYNWIHVMWSKVNNYWCTQLLILDPHGNHRTILQVGSRPEFAQDHESGLRSDRGPVVQCDFSKLRFWKSPYDFLNLLVLIRPPLTYQYEQLYTTKFSKFIQDARTSTRRCSVLEYQLVNTKFSFAHGYSWCKYLLPRV